MRVGLIIYGSLDSVSGGYLYDRQLVAALKRAGHQVEPITLPWRNYAAHLADNWDRELFERLKNGRFDLLLQDELNHPSLFLLNQRLKSEKEFQIVSIVHHLRSCEVNPSKWKTVHQKIERAYLKSCDAFIFNSAATAESVVALLGCHSLIGHIARPAGNRFEGINQEQIKVRVLRSTNKRKILFVGNISRRKGVDVLIEALGRLKHGQFECDLVGSLTTDSEYVAQIERQINQLGLKSRVKMRGQLSDDGLADAFKMADLLVVPSQHEGFGIVYLEGMGFGLPAIGSASGGAAELISDGSNGFLIRYGEVDCLKERIQLLITDDQKLLQMSLAARETYETMPSWDVLMDGAVRFLENL